MKHHLYVQYTGLASTHAFHQYSDISAHTSPDIPWKLLSMSLDPAEGKSSISGERLRGFGRKRDWCLHFESLRSKQTPQEPIHRHYVVTCWKFDTVLHILELVHFKTKHLNTAQKITINLFSTWNGKKDNFKNIFKQMVCEEHEEECALQTDNVEIGPPLNYKSPLSTDIGTLNWRVMLLSFHLGGKAKTYG